MGEKQSGSKARMRTQDASLLFNHSHPSFKLPWGSEMLKKHLAGSSCFHRILVTAGPRSATARQADSEIAGTLTREKRNDPQPLPGFKISPHRGLADASGTWNDDDKTCGTPRASL